MNDGQITGDAGSSAAAAPPAPPPPPEPKKPLTLGEANLRSAESLAAFFAALEDAYLPNRVLEAAAAARADAIELKHAIAATIGGAAS